MRIAVVSSLVGLLGGCPSAALADLRAPIAGAAPILPAVFTPLGRRLRAIGDPAAPTGSAAPVLWSVPLLDRRLSQAEKDADLAPALLDAILRVESSFDPTRVDLFGDLPAWEVRPGTATMNNVFADRWHLADSDPNVHAMVRYIAEAWTARGSRGCDAFYKNRAPIGGLALGTLAAEDCARLTRIEADREDSWTRMPVVAAALPLPAFAAPLPGARLSSQDFWAAQKARIAAIQARLKDKWRAAATR